LYFLEGSRESQKPMIIEEQEAHPEVKQNLDLDKLSYAVSMAETGGCKDGTAIKRHNCHGIMQWKNGVRSPKYFNSFEESNAAFKKIWAKSYKIFPTLTLARHWTGNDKPTTWLSIVKKYYYSH